MLTVAQIEPYITQAFAEGLEARGFHLREKRRWIRSTKVPIRELFSIVALKGGTYSPCWGISCGYVPILKGGKFTRQNTERAAVADLVIDPVDVTGQVDPHTFSFITGADTRIPLEEIATCARHFVPQALADFDRVPDLPAFCRFFQERSALEYRRFQFFMYLQHRLTRGFVEILLGRFDEGQRQLAAFCAEHGVDYEDRTLTACIGDAKDAAREM
jgi:hypothetical protein